MVDQAGCPWQPDASLTFGDQCERTDRLRSTLAAVGLALAGRAGARIARVLGVSVRPASSGCR
ncbi:hypothetical protein ACH4U7_10695 [Streptomyces sp. NPDC020845]|uniref:hypothetical protein n=1 Tax=Streptomyces sp. NPDC020845 TaxID=3365096 RepID=UPI0037966434